MLSSHFVSDHESRAQYCDGVCVHLRFASFTGIFSHPPLRILTPLVVLAHQVMPVHFADLKMSGFLRQLSFYGFKKVGWFEWD